MKYIFKTFLILYLLFNFNNSFSQNNNEKKYQRIKINIYRF